MDDLAPEREDVELKELVQLCAVDGLLFARTFFPNTVRQESAPFHRDVWKLLDSTDRLVNMQVFRDGAKTSLLRMYTAKRIAYGLGRTILYIGKSEGHAARSVNWLRTQVEHNRQYNSVFQLRPGRKWQDTECQIYHAAEERPIWILGVGITGSIRGINLEDFRPDLIVIDDVIDEENSATAEQRNKIEDLILGALKGSLAPVTESPDAKMVMLQTPLNKEDASCKALVDPEWVSRVFGCWTPDTVDLTLDQQESAWPARWPSSVLRKEKEAAVARNKLSLWLREKECKLISPETSTFREEWLKFYELSPEAHSMQVVMCIDPVPPPSEKQIAKGLRTKDFEAFAVVGKHNGDYHLLDYSLNRGHTPEWTVSEFFRLGLKWHPKRILVETVAYQKTLEWFLRKAMQHQRKYFVIQGIDDKRKKYDVITDGLSGVSSNGRLFVRADQHEFITQFRSYPDVNNDDLIETVARCVIELEGPKYDDYGDAWQDVMQDESGIPALEYASGAP